MPLGRFRDDGRSAVSFARSFLVVCPQCGACASVLPTTAAAGYHTPRRLSCLHCGCVRSWPAAQPPKPRPQWGPTQRVNGETVQLAIGMFTATSPSPQQFQRRGPRDWYFNQPLYLQTACLGHILWSHNVEHLNAMEALIAAGLRETPHAQGQPQSMAHKLPKWMILAKHRDTVLYGAQQLRLKLLR